MSGSAELDNDRHVLADRSPDYERHSSSSNMSLSFDNVHATHSLQQLCLLIDEQPELQKASILKSSTYHKWRLVLHRFVVLKLHIPGRSDLWLRLDRRPLPGLPFILGSGITLANDQVSSKQHSKNPFARHDETKATSRNEGYHLIFQVRVFVTLV